MPTGVRRPALIGELVIILVLVKVYDLVRGLEAERRGPALRNAHAVVDVQRWLHIDVEHAATHWLAAHTTLSLIASWWYQLAHITVTLTVLGWCYLRRPEVYRQARNALALTNVAGLIVFVVLPVMPPRLLPGGGYVDAVAAAGFGATHTAGPVPADQYAAMPSLHLAWATWTAAVAVTLLAGRRWNRLCFAYPVVTAVVVVVTGNHYVLDVFAGVIVAVLALLAARALPDQITLRRTRMASTQAPGSSGTQTVSSR